MDRQLWHNAVPRPGEQSSQGKDRKVDTVAKRKKSRFQIPYSDNPMRDVSFRFCVCCTIVTTTKGADII